MHPRQHPRQPQFFDLDLDDLVARLRDLGGATAETAADALCEYDHTLRVALARLDEARREQQRIRESYAAVSR